MSSLLRTTPAVWVESTTEEHIENLLRTDVVILVSTLLLAVGSGLGCTVSVAIVMCALIGIAEGRKRFPHRFKRIFGARSAILVRMQF